MNPPLPPTLPSLFHVIGTRHTMSSFAIICFAFRIPPSPTYIHLHQVSGNKHSSLIPSYILTTIFVTFLISYAYFFCMCTLYVKQSLYYTLYVLYNFHLYCCVIEVVIMLSEIKCLSLKLRSIHIY